MSASIARQTGVPQIRCVVGDRERLRCCSLNYVVLDESDLADIGMKFDKEFASYRCYMGRPIGADGSQGSHDHGTEWMRKNWQ